MTPEERLVTAAKTVARTKQLHKAADKIVSKRWAIRHAVLAAVVKKHDAICDATRRSRETTYRNLSVAQREYDDALIAFHLDVVEVK